ncbi:MAG TPA: DUF2339 domain-containing protein [Candidatus Limnocylindrales bacterium]
MTPMPPDEQLRHLLAKPDWLLAETVNDSLSRVLRSHDLIAANTTQLNRDLHALAEALEAQRATASATSPALAATPQPTVRVEVAALKPTPPPSAPRPAGPAPVGPLAARQLEVASRPPAPSVQTAPSIPPPVGPPAHPAQTSQRLAPSWPVTPTPAPAPKVPVGTALAARLGISRAQLVSRLVAGVGAVITLVGVAFILVLAAQNGYFGPLARTIACGVLGGVLAGAAFLVRRRDADNAGAHALLATGAAAGYLSLYAAGSLYSFLPSWVALTGTAALGLAVVGIAVRWKSQWLASLGVASASLIGAYLGGDPRVGVAFAVVLSVVMILAQLRTSWPVFLVARTVPAMALLTIAALAAKPGTSIETVLLAVIAGIFAIAGLISAWIGRKAGTREQIVIAVLVTLAPLPALYAMWQLGRVWGAVSLVVLAATYLVAAALPLFSRVPRSAVIPVGALLITMAGLRMAGGDHTSTVLAAVAAAYASVALYSRSRLVALASAVLGSISTVLWIPGAVTLVVFAEYSSPVGTSAFLAAWALLAYLACRVLEFGRPRWYRNVAMILGLLGASAAVDSIGVIVGRTVHDVHAGYVIASATVTVLWALASVLALWTPLRRGAGAGWVTLGLSLAGAATAKLFAIDLAVLGGIERGLAFLGVGVLLLVLGVGYAKAYERARGETPPAPAPGGEGPI